MDKRRLLAKLHILLKQTGAENHKEDLYASYGVDSAADMTDVQLLDLIGKLDPTQNSLSWKVTDYEVRAMRSEVLFVLTANPDAQQVRRRGLGVPNDWQVLNPFIYEHAGKPLTAMSYDELVAFKKQLYAMRATGWRYRAKGRYTPPPKTPDDNYRLVVVGLPTDGVVN